MPDARIAVGHGQMDQEELSDVWRSMVAGEVDVLVCTTIIETGVDIPNANTLIIEEADRLGLSQLHQIRGRVGRSSRKAYAYFTFAKNRALTEVATKRLETIREYTEFGSGFKIAMRDLEIRGAGNLLGAEQHGQMEAVGYDMYIKLLEEAILEEKGEDLSKSRSRRNECLIDVRVDAYIPEKYISNEMLRIDVYKKIAAIENQEDALDVRDELIDRFGAIPTPTASLIDIALIRNAAAQSGVVSIEEKAGSLLLYPPASGMDLKGWSATAARFRGKMLLSMGSRPYVAWRLSPGEAVPEVLKKVFVEYQKAGD